MYNLDNYETVEDRLAKFWAEHKADGRIATRLLEVARDPDGKPRQYLVEAAVWVGERCVATGLAEEVVGASPVNRTSALENAETSAIGRALANANYAKKGSRPSREEMAKTTRSRGIEPDDPFYSSPPVKDAPRANHRQLYKIAKMLEARGVTGKAEQLAAVNAALEAEQLPTVTEGRLLPAAQVTAVMQRIEAMPIDADRLVDNLAKQLGAHELPP